MIRLNVFFFSNDAVGTMGNWASHNEVAVLFDGIDGFDAGILGFALDLAGRGGVFFPQNS